MCALTAGVLIERVCVLRAHVWSESKCVMMCVLAMLVCWECVCVRACDLGARVLRAHLCWCVCWQHLCVCMCVLTACVYVRMCVLTACDCVEYALILNTWRWHLSDKGDQVTWQSVESLQTCKILNETFKASASSLSTIMGTPVAQQARLFPFFFPVFTLVE